MQFVSFKRIQHAYKMHSKGIVYACLALASMDCLFALHVCCVHVVRIFGAGMAAFKLYCVCIGRTFSCNELEV